ncbi:MAG TPA: hypothetical protein VME70_04225 [Mycobacteriales bacterium]|nr:hypothetical protein [Mycobacteriales bacterium]
MHPAFANELVKQRVDEMQRRPIRRTEYGERGLHRVRRSTGWFLVNVGLRLAAPRTSLSPAAR